MALGLIARETLTTRRGWAAIGRGVWASVFSGVALIIAGFVAIVVMALVLILDKDPAGMWLLMFTPIASSIMFVLIRGFVAGGFLWTRWGHRGARLMLARGLCPRCGYEIVGLGASGRVTCPECACVWRGDRIGHDRPEVREVVVVSE
jgi:hypothetical protein